MKKKDAQMESLPVEHSDSDSGESWTLLENSPTYGREAPDFPDSGTVPSERMNNEVHCDKDEDTDGISIISDSDQESSSCEINYVPLPPEEAHVEQPQNFPSLTAPSPNNINHNDEALREGMDFLGDNTKFKTYVHRRNPKVGTILDVIMLGTFVITAGMALGHLWSSRSECTPQASVNKVLSNLYKLQEENAYLRNKLKEITLATGYQAVQRKLGKSMSKQQRCKKIFEEPIITNKPEAVVKCVNDDKSTLKPHDHTLLPEHEKELLKDIDRMKEIYNKNKNWLDKEVKKQVEEFKKSAIDSPKLEPKKAYLGILSGSKEILQNTVQPQVNVMQERNIWPKKSVYSHRHINFEKQLGPIYYDIPPTAEKNNEDKVKSNIEINLDRNVGIYQQSNQSNSEDMQNDTSKIFPKPKITYADSLKINQPFKGNQGPISNDKPSIWTKVGKRKLVKYDNELPNLNSFSEDDIKKDDRYTGPKTKHENKKHDRQKSHKKQKRNNKYEQWEMKGGYLKDFDELSIASTQDNDKNLVMNPDRLFKDPDFAKYVIKFMDTETNDSNASNKVQAKVDKGSEKAEKVEKRAMKGDKPRKKGKNKDWQWYDLRSSLRAEARMKLEHELFGENTSNNAAWYFRRMQKREQCRAQKDNSTYKKIPKKKMNFKMKR